MTRVRHVEIVVPARNEEQQIGACLHSLRHAADALRRRRPDVSYGITVVLDCCTDRTEERVQKFGARVLVSSSGCVGRARHAGTVDAIGRAQRAGIDAGRLWIAGTDADSAVPALWLETQVALADSGIDAVIGTVIPSGLGPQMYRQWRSRHDLAEGHDHVHGANLGVRASTYCRAGGYGDLSVGEDVDLVERIRGVTDQWIATNQTCVTTSGRTHSRVVGGFASYVSELDVEVS